MRWLFLLLWMGARMGLAQVPDSGTFRYQLFDNSDRPVGRYDFTIEKEGKLWRITSDMDIDTRVFFLRIRLHDHNSFTHDGQSFQSFTVKYFKDVPLQKTVDQNVEGRLEGKMWQITSTQAGQSVLKTYPADAFEEIRNLVSRYIRPEAILRPGETRSTRSLDPLTLEIGLVESLGLREESIDFQGKTRRLHVMEQKAADGDVIVKKFDNGLIYRSQTSNGYALLQSALTPGF